MYEFLDRKKYNVRKFVRTNRDEGLDLFLRERLESIKRKAREHSKCIKILRKYLAFGLNSGVYGGTFFFTFNLFNKSVISYC